MNETSQPSHRHHLKGAAAAMSGVLGIAALAVASPSFAGRVHPPPLRLTAASTTGSTSADRVAVGYVDAHYPGPGTAKVLTTEPDVERGTAVYDVRVLAPNGTTYVVAVRRSNDSVLSASPAEGQTTPSAPALPALPSASSPTPSLPPLSPSPGPTAPLGLLPQSTPSSAAAPEHQPETPEPVDATEPPEPPPSPVTSADTSPDHQHTSVTPTAGESSDQKQTSAQQTSAQQTSSTPDSAPGH